MRCAKTVMVTSSMRALLRRGVDCLLGASLVYGMLLITTGLNADLSLEGKLLRHRGLSHGSASIGAGELRGVVGAAAAAVEAAEAVTREEGAASLRRSRNELLERLLAARMQLVKLQQESLEAAGPTQLTPEDRSSSTWPYPDPQNCRCPMPMPTPPMRHGVLGVDDVAFGILTSERFVETRLASQIRTWLRRVRHVVFYSESDMRWLPTVKLTPPPAEELVGGGAWKNFPALMDLHHRFPTKKWIFFTDDDTCVACLRLKRLCDVAAREPTLPVHRRYVFVENLLAAIGKYDHNRDFYVGLYWTPRVDMEWKEVQIAYASGGAGYALSRALLGRLAPRMLGCHSNYTRWAGDVRVGKCAADVGVRVTPGVGFHHEAHDKYNWDSSGGSFPYGHMTQTASAAVQAPATFHHLTVDQIATYNRMQIAEHRGPHGELFRYDFGAPAAQQLRQSSQTPPHPNARAVAATLPRGSRVQCPVHVAQHRFSSKSTSLTCTSAQRTTASVCSSESLSRWALGQTARGERTFPTRSTSERSTTIVQSC